MPQFTVRNEKPTAIDVVIEPWAGAETLAPNAEALFDYDDPADVSITAEENGNLFVCIWSERVRWIANGAEQTLTLPP